jgi:hypothetical protein
MHHKRIFRVGIVVYALLFCAAAPGVRATPITDVSYIAADIEGRVATARFEIVGGSLVITLTNASGVDVEEKSQVLCAVFFDIDGPALNLDQSAPGASVVLSPGSTVLFGGGTDGPPSFPVGNVGGEWGYGEELSQHNSGNPPRGTYGASGATYGLFHPSDRFPGTNLEGGISVDNLGYCLTSAGDDPSTGNPQVTGNGGSLIKNGVVITIPGVPAGFSLDALSNVGFQYGKSLNDTYLQGIIPEPSSVALLGLAGLFIFRRRR